MYFFTIMFLYSRTVRLNWGLKEVHHQTRIITLNTIVTLWDHYWREFLSAAVSNSMKPTVSMAVKRSIVQLTNHSELIDQSRGQNFSWAKINALIQARTHWWASPPQTNLSAADQWRKLSIIMTNSWIDQVHYAGSGWMEVSGEAISRLIWKVGWSEAELDNTMTLKNRRHSGPALAASARFFLNSFIVRTSSHIYPN